MTETYTSDTGEVDVHNVRGRSAATEAIRDHRRVLVGQMLLARVPIRTIASRLRVSTNTVQRDIAVVTRYWEQRAIKDRATLVHRECVILDELEAAWLQRALYDVNALDGVLRIQARRTKLLGLDAPTRSSVEVTGDLDSLRARAQELVEDELARRRELRERAQMNVIDVASSENGQ